MRTITVRNVNHALPIGLAMLRDEGARVAPRGKETLEMQDPVATIYRLPDEVVLFDQSRDANPFFHFFEALWIIQGRKDVKFLSWLLPNMAEYSDDGVEYHAPYGYRLRHEFGFDQIEAAIGKLAADPDSRQAVMTIWNPNRDWQRTKDVPCNDMVMLKLREGALRMTVCNRSNDVVWGAYGANAVQFGTLLKYMAGRLNCSVGHYTQISDSYHVYTDLPFWVDWLSKNPGGVASVDDPYKHHGWASASPFLNTPEVFDRSFDNDLATFFELWDKRPGEAMNMRLFATDSFVEVALPLYDTLRAWRDKDTDLALKVSEQIIAQDWKLGAQMWVQRRIKKLENKNA